MWLPAEIILKAIDKVSGPLKRISLSAQTMSKDTRRSLQSVGGAAKRVGFVVSGTAAAVSPGLLAPEGQHRDRPGRACLGGHQETDRALEKAGRKFSNKWAVASKPEFLQAAYDIKSGISSLSDEGVADVTRLAGVTAQATKATVGQMTSLFATGYNIFKKQFKNLNDQDFANQFAAGLAATVQGFKTNGPQMQQAIESMGDSLTNANVPLSEQLVLLGMLQGSMKGAESGTAVKAFGASVARAGKQLGLPFLNAQKQMRSVPEILDLLRQKYGDTLDALEKEDIRKAFGSEEALKVLDNLYGKQEQYRQEVKRTTEEMNRGALHVQMAKDQNVGLGQIFKIVSHQAGNLADGIGKVLSPLFKPLADKIGGVLVSLQDWTEAHPRLTKVIMLGAIGLGALVAALGIATTAMLAFNLAVLANPVTWIVAAIIAAVVVLAGAAACFGPTGTG